MRRLMVELHQVDSGVRVVLRWCWVVPGCCQYVKRPKMKLHPADGGVRVVPVCEEADGSAPNSCWWCLVGVEVVF